jgi:hypothetical protein
MAQNGKNGTKWYKMAQNGIKWHKMACIARELIADVLTNLHKIAKKYLKIVQDRMPQNC